MKKESYRDYATDAYIFWAEKGYISGADYIDAVKRKAIARSKDAEPEEAYKYISVCVANNTASQKDLDACCRAFDFLRDSNKDYICDAVKNVYGVCPHKALKRGEITGRVKAYACAANTDERNVYRWLAQARKIFAAMRGLRMGGDCDECDDAADRGGGQQG